MLLQRLCETHGVSGNEQEVRKILLKEIEACADEITIDIMGNLIVRKRSANDSAPKVMVCAHMDEVGLIISEITDKGYLKFKTVGGIDARVLVGKKVVVGKSRVNGVIALKAVHLQTEDERKVAVKAKDLYMDIGTKSRQEAEELVSLGDYAAFDTEFSEFGEGLFKAKALDDRCGCAILAKLFQGNYDCDLYACFTVQEEVGCRGAKIAANRISPDIALIIEATSCSDIAGVDPHLQVTTLGGGAAVSIMDAASYSDKKLIKTLFRLAEQRAIPVQYKRTTLGGNDAGAVQTSGIGVRTAVVSVPCRYLHSPVSVISRTDYKAVYDLAHAFLENVKECVT